MLVPARDVGFQRYAAKGHYQRNVLMAAMSHVSNWTRAVDIGAHIGFVSRDMAPFFRKVHAFEPNPENAWFLRQNVPENVRVIESALGREARRAGMHNPRDDNTGAWELCDGDEIEVTALDSYEFSDVGLIKIDVQGCEMDVLAGAADTLERCRPVVLVEIPKEWRERAMAGELSETMKFLADMGATRAAQIREDVVMRWA